MPLTICTWNINSVRLREPIVLKLLAEEAPDVLCLQETKSPPEKVPLEGFAALGYGHVRVRGDKGYNGVAILSRLPLGDVAHRDWCAMGDARHVAARLPNGVEIHNFYVPAGGDVPDVNENPKFAHKLQFVDEMAEWGATAMRGAAAIAVGDLNIAPREDDVWSHRQLLKVVSHTPVEVEKFAAAQAAGGWVDVTRKHVPEGKLYSWWSYRSRDWSTSDRGRRLDHVWATGDVAVASTASRILKPARGWEKPSDHAPVFAVFDL